ncbi:hypothetical protein L596_018841 [Steinernema carpocapsae]|uniref:Uncharacterized protein n=1 Tax=Steinernema carpocapsae TaxID=34508 RepID=A0A4V6A263_STECR|nr:hypothetical protein L596_018841 [Steinernema carpocapsae]
MLLQIEYRILAFQWNDDSSNYFVVNSLHATSGQSSIAILSRHTAYTAKMCPKHERPRHPASHLAISPDCPSASDLCSTLIALKYATITCSRHFD